MPEPYSNDLRRKFFEVYDRGDGSLKELAKRFRVSESWAKKLSARRSKTGQIEIRRWRHGPESRVTAAARDLDPGAAWPATGPAAGGAATAAGAGATAALEPELDLGPAAPVGVAA